MKKRSFYVIRKQRDLFHRISIQLHRDAVTGEWVIQRPESTACADTSLVNGTMWHGLKNTLEPFRKTRIRLFLFQLRIDISAKQIPHLLSDIALVPTGGLIRNAHDNQ